MNQTQTQTVEHLFYTHNVTIFVKNTIFNNKKSSVKNHAFGLKHKMFANLNFKKRGR